ncbi:GAF domain-containing protein [bacterium]|nr:GAF domain-containing protein [bacterium]MBQ4437247.1 GAF domain-containing protein [bacterium]
MKNLKICTAIRNKAIEDEIIKIIQDSGWRHSNVIMDDVLNEHRSVDQVFIIEDNYSQILNLVEFHNSCYLNFIPTVVLSAVDSKCKDWVKGVKFPEKYFHCGLMNFRMIAPQTIETMSALAEAHKNLIVKKYREATTATFKKSALDFRAFLDEVLSMSLDILYAGRGSIMLLNEKGNLVIEAATKKEIVGIEIPPSNENVAWTVVNTMKPIFVENIDNDPRFKKSSSGYTKDHFMSIPIFLNKKIAGVFNLSDKMVSLLFDNNDYEKANELLSVLEPYLYINKLANYIRTLRNQ